MKIITQRQRKHFFSLPRGTADIWETVDWGEKGPQCTPQPVPGEGATTGGYLKFEYKNLPRVTTNPGLSFRIHNSRYWSTRWANTVQATNCRAAVWFTEYHVSVYTSIFRVFPSFKVCLC